MPEEDWKILGSECGIIGGRTFISVWGNLSVYCCVEQKESGKRRGIGKASGRRDG